MASKLEINLPTIAGVMILGIFVFMLLTYLLQQFFPTFKGLPFNMGFMFIILIVAGMIAITVLKKEFAFPTKSEFVVLVILIIMFVVLTVYFAPSLLNGTPFSGATIQLQSMLGVSS